MQLYTLANLTLRKIIYYSVKRENLIVPMANDLCRVEKIDATQEHVEVY